MKHILKYIAIPFLVLALAACQERYVTYSDAEYVMFADTIATYPVQNDVEYFSVPVVSTVTRDYDRTFGVEIIDGGSNAIEKVHYSLKSNTVTIKAGELMKATHLIWKLINLNSAMQMANLIMAHHLVGVLK